MYYVYTLTDPRNDAVFYIGKGKGRRAWRHEANERNGVERNGLKAEVLAEIRRAGLKPGVSIVKGDLTETEAFDLEREMIRATASTLTNTSQGSRSPLDVVRADARYGLGQIKPLCQLIREGADASRLGVWVRVISGLSRIARVA